MKTTGWVVVANAVSALLAQLGLASGQVELQSTSYLRTSADRFTNGGAFALQYEKSGQKKWLESRTNLSLNGYGSDVRSLTPEVRELYLSTNDALSRLHRISFGRKTQVWSEADETWQLGTWAPRFNWDPLRPVQVGLTGLSYDYNSRLVGIRVFGSPVVIPERGAPLRVEDGRLISSNPDAAVPFDSVSVLNQNVPIRYRLEMPNLGDLMFHPSIITKVRLGERNQGLWSSITAGIKPMNVVDVSAEAGLRLQPDSYIDAALFPRMVDHRLATVEAGWKSPDFQAWASVSRETPLDAGLPLGRSGSPMGEATLSAWGIQFKGFRKSVLGLSGINIQERLAAPSEGDVQIALPSRYRFKQAIRVGWDYEAHERLKYSTAWLRDFGGQGDWLTVNAQYAFAKSRWRLGVSADFFSVRAQTGFLAPYSGNDRFQGRLTYVF